MAQKLLTTGNQIHHMEWVKLNAFDTAWDLLKAPLDMDSIKEVPNEWGKRFTADFVDPETDIRYPMTYHASDAHDEGVVRP